MNKIFRNDNIKILIVRKIINIDLKLSLKDI